MALAWSWSGQNDDVLAYASRWLPQGPPDDAASALAWAQAFAPCCPTLFATFAFDFSVLAPKAFDFAIESEDGRAALVCGPGLIACTDIPKRLAAALDLGARQGLDRLIAAYGPWYLLWIDGDDELSFDHYLGVVAEAAGRDPGPHTVWSHWLTRFRATGGFATDPSLILPDAPGTAARFLNDRINAWCGPALFALRNGDSTGLREAEEILSGYPSVPIANLFTGACRAVNKILGGEHPSAEERSFLGASYASTPPQLMFYVARTLIALDDLDAAAGTIAAISREQSSSSRLPDAMIEATLALRNADPALADAKLVAASALALSARWKDQVIHWLELSSVVSSQYEDHDRAAHLAGAAERLRDELQLTYRFPDQQSWLDHAESAGRAALGPDLWTNAKRRGRDTQFADAIGYATRARGPRARPSMGWGSLTPAELEVTRLIAEGLTNPQIAERLLMGRATVKTHVSHALTKLGLSNRHQLAREIRNRDGIDTTA